MLPALSSDGPMIDGLLQLHCLRLCTRRANDEVAVTKERRALSVSGPPLMVYVKITPCHKKDSSAHIVLRIDLYNATGLSFQNVKIEIGITRTMKQQLKHVEPDMQVWSFGAIYREQCFEIVPCRGTVALWRELRIKRLRPCSITLTISYDNTSQEQNGPSIGPTASGLTQTSQGPDAWSDDEAEENDRLYFTCSPCPMPLSVYFQPFYGLDTPMGGVFPPPAIYTACPHAYASAQPLGRVDPELWNPSGLHRISPHTSQQVIAPDVKVCFVGLQFDGVSLLCLCYQRPSGGRPFLEIRSNKEELVYEFEENLQSWLHVVHT